jgi:hypothetical protein
VARSLGGTRFGGGLGDKDLKRYIVSFETFRGKRTSYSVVVWYGRDKAVALAAAHHSYEHSKDEMFRVLVQELGTPEQNPNGTPVLPDDDVPVLRG